MFDIIVGVVASLIAALILFVLKFWLSPHISTFKSNFTSSSVDKSGGRESFSSKELRDTSSSKIKINCPRCNEINSIFNLCCDNCGQNDIARKNIADRGMVKPLLLSLFSIVTFPINMLAGIILTLLTIKSYIFMPLAGAFIPMFAIGKLFGYFEKVSWEYIGIGTLAFFIIGALQGVFEYALENEDSAPHKILRFIIMFIFPPLYIMTYLNYYKPREAFEEIAWEAKRNLDQEISTEDAKKILMAKYKKRDNIISDISKVISGERNICNFSNDYLYKYFFNDKNEAVLIAYGIVLIIYILIFLYSIGLF